MSNTDAHKPVKYGHPEFEYTGWTDNRRFAKPKAERGYARFQQGAVRTRERMAIRRAMKGQEIEMDTRHRHNAAWAVG